MFTNSIDFAAKTSEIMHYLQTVAIYILTQFSVLRNTKNIIAQNTPSINIMYHCFSHIYAHSKSAYRNTLCRFFENRAVSRRARKYGLAQALHTPSPTCAGYFLL